MKYMNFSFLNHTPYIYHEISWGAIIWNYTVIWNIYFFRLAKEGGYKKAGWPGSTYVVSKVGVSALTRIQQRAFDSDSREDLAVNSCHPGYVDTDMISHKVYFHLNKLSCDNIPFLLEVQCFVHS